MDEADFDKSRREPGVEDIDATRTPHAIIERTGTTAPSPRGATGSRQNLWIVDRSGPGTGIVWVRASDLLSSGTGRIAGRGLNLETELARRARRIPAATRRAIRGGTHRLPPLSAFGLRSGHAPIRLNGLGRN